MKTKCKILTAVLSIIMLLSAVPTLAVSAATSDKSLNVVPLATSSVPDPIEAIDTYIEKFYYYRRGVGQLRNEPSNGFWTDAEILEIFIDAYELIGDEKYLTVAKQFYDGIIQRRGTDWAWNDYNDDIFWMVLATIRLYKNTNDAQYLQVAKANFDLCYNRAWDTNFLDGGLWWRTDNQSKNGCVNGPGALSALMIYETTKDEKYLTIGKGIVDWMIGALFNEKTGQFYDNINISGEMNTWTNTGNQGNVIGPCTMLYKFTGEEKYYNYALKAAEHAATLGDGGKEILNEGGNSGDTIGGKGLLARWLGYFIRECNVDDFDKFMINNARSAWAMRNSDGLMWGEFGKQTVEDIQNCDDMLDQDPNVTKGKYAAWGCSAAVSWLLHTPKLLSISMGETKTDTEAPVTTAAQTTEEEGEPKTWNVVAITGVVGLAVVLLAGGITVAVIVIKKKR